jgi:hypothetical protein
MVGPIDYGVMSVTPSLGGSTLQALRHHPNAPSRAPDTCNDFARSRSASRAPDMLADGMEARAALRRTAVPHRNERVILATPRLVRNPRL